MLIYWPKLLYPYYSLLLFFLSLLSVYRLVLWGWGHGLIGCTSLSLSLALPTFFNNNNKEDKKSPATARFLMPGGTKVYRSVTKAICVTWTGTYVTGRAPYYALDYT